MTRSQPTGQGGKTSSPCKGGWILPGLLRGDKAWETLFALSPLPSGLRWLLWAGLGLRQGSWFAEPDGPKLSEAFVQLGSDFDLSDALDDFKDEKPTAKPRKPTADHDLNLEDALGGGGNDNPAPQPYPPRPKPDRNPNQPGTSDNPAPQPYPPRPKPDQNPNQPGTSDNPAPQPYPPRPKPDRNPNQPGTSDNPAPQPYPPRPKPDQNPNQPGTSGGGFSDKELADAVPEGGGGGGGDGGGSQRKEDEGGSPPGVVPGIVGAVVVAVAGAISSFIAYQKKKFCFKENDQSKM
ncbi:CD99 antigen [Tupaia chinensis]|uniref:CD99 antigen n=1 Tax=Tupaia chinensis TaxID=246437 RepID=UPI0007043B17|nr:CD99 antigen [Tupaia chinensis]